MASAKPKKKCYYEVLGVERTAGDDEIKKSFRKLALQQHPDKNPDRVEEAKEEFQKLQQAYEVLSNPQERAWYDKHREAVLREGFDQDDDDFIVDLFPYFVSSCYSGFNDDEKGFYTVYREVFELIANDDLDAGCEEEIPSFGDSLSGYEDVVGPFYAFWEGYCTSRSFVWKDEYDSRHAGNRLTARYIERENKKIRSEAKKAWNQQVRSLVDFVKRKDKRFQEWRTKQDAIRKQKEEEVAKKMLQEKQKKREERKKTLESLKKQRETEQKKIDMHMKEMADIYGHHESNDESDEEEPSCLYCAACNKSFRTEKAFENHEKSKKHLAEIQRLREEMEEDDELVNEQDDNETSHEEVQDTESEIDEPEENASSIGEGEINPNEDCQSEDVEIEGKINDLKIASESESSDELDISTFVKKEKKAKTKGKSRAVFQARNNSESDEATKEKSPVPNLSAEEADEAETSKSSKKKRRRAKKTNGGTKPEPPKAEQATGPKKDPFDKDEGDKNDDNVPSKCMVCNQTFPSRSKLFKHIKSTGHAAPLTAVKANLSKINELSKAGKKKKGKGRDS